MRLILGALGLLLAGTALTGCGDSGSDVDDPSGSTGSMSESTSTTPDVRIEHATGADDVVLSIVTAGGFVPSEYAYTTQPRLLLLGDGRIVVPSGDGATASRIVPVLEGQLDEGQVQQVLALADDADLLDAPPDYNPDAGAVVTDAPTTTVVITADRVTREHAAYALGLSAQGDTSARKRLAAFVADVGDLVDDVDTTDYEPTRLRLMATPVEGRVPGRFTVEAWPADDVDLADPADSAECGVVAPDDPATLVDALSRADLSTYFSQGDQVYSVAARAVLPGEADCTGS